MSHQKLSGPYSLEEMMAAKNEILTLESSIDDSWETWVDLGLGGSDSCRLFRRYLPDKGLYMYKSVIRMDFSASEYFEYYKDNEYRKTWDQTIQEVSCVAEEEDNEVWYWAVKYPWPLAVRDYVFYRRCMSFPDEDLFLMCGRAVPIDRHPNFRPEVKGYVRVEDYVSTLAVRGVGEGKMEILVVYFDDPRGSIPKTIINLVANKMIPKGFADNKTAMLKYKDYKGC